MTNDTIASQDLPTVDLDYDNIECPDNLLELLDNLRLATVCLRNAYWTLRSDEDQGFWIEPEVREQLEELMPDLLSTSLKVDMCYGLLIARFLNNGALIKYLKRITQEKT